MDVLAQEGKLRLQLLIGTTVLVYSLICAISAAYAEGVEEEIGSLPRIGILSLILWQVYQKKKWARLLCLFLSGILMLSFFASFALVYQAITFGESTDIILAITVFILGGIAAFWFWALLRSVSIKSYLLPTEKSDSPENAT